MASGRAWTEEDLYYLQDNWGSVSIKGIARRLGRSVNAVKLKAGRIGLSDPRLHYDGITLNQLADALGISYTILKNWINLYDLPAKQKLFAVKERVLVITYEDFWKWSEKNKQMLDFSRVERLSLGPEPDWVDEKRKADQLRKLYVPKPHNTPWTKSDDRKLISMLNQFKYTYPEIAAELKRSQGAIKRRIWDLKLKARPVRLPNHIKYTEEEEKTIIDMLEKGYCFDTIAAHLNRSTLAIRGKAERMGYRFKNGVPYLVDRKEVQ